MLKTALAALALAFAISTASAHSEIKLFPRLPLDHVKFEQCMSADGTMRFFPDKVMRKKICKLRQDEENGSRAFQAWEAEQPTYTD